MTVYVDDMRRRAHVAGGPRWGATWSHLMADTHDELVDFAVNRLGLRASWIQHEGKVIEHFDVTDTVRKRAIALGAVEISYGGEESKALMRRKMAARDAAKKETT
jgi:hypothetical protein